MPRRLDGSVRAMRAAAVQMTSTDDLDRNLHVAQSLGMIGILHRSAQSSIAQMAEHLGLDRAILLNGSARH